MAKLASSSQRVATSQIEVLLTHFFDRPGRGLLLRGQTSVEIEAVFFLDVKADEGRIGNDHALIVDIGQLSLWGVKGGRTIFL